MAFTKKTWVNVPDPSNLPSIPGGQDALARFDAENMNRIEKGIEEAHTSKAPSGHGLGTIPERFDQVTFQSLMKEGCGFYAVDEAPDTPADTPVWTCMMQLSRGGEDGDETGVQMIMPDKYPNEPRIWYRAMFLGKIGNWVEMIHTGNAVDELSKLGMARFASGSYVGTGTRGADNPTIIPIPFRPKILMIDQEKLDGAYIIHGYNLQDEYTYCPDMPSGTSATSYSKYHEGSAYFYMYGGGEDTGTRAQFNKLGETYYWYAFG